MAKSKKPNPKPKTAKASEKAAAKPAAKKKAAKKSKPAAQTAKKKPAAKKKKNDLMCFLTTACMRYYSLPDDSYELNTLRHYRDTWLAASPGGKALIRQYYEVSPKIVELANADAGRQTVFTFIYDKIREACERIERREYSEAKNVYLGLVQSLMKRYHMRSTV